ncbi:hypothetical protein BBP40_011393 [Aspergillus hancockii]|nr:hypothetical protein BBP40_011393 [Aspergillus hancockii]
MGEPGESTDVKSGWNKSCLFPKLRNDFDAGSHEMEATVVVPLDHPNLVLDFCERHGVQVPQVLQLSWGIVLQSYTASEHILFGYVDDRMGINDSAVCCLDLTESGTPIQELIQRLCYIDLSSMGSNSDQTLWNTTIMWNRTEKCSRQVKSCITAHMNNDDCSVTLRYWKSAFTDKQAKNIARTWANIISQVSRCVESCVHDIILQQCKARGLETAVYAWDGQFSYNELDRLSSNLAQHLWCHGVGPETFVALYFDKSKWTAVAILAVMRAGGAFILLDPAYPKYRIEEICRQMNVTIILSSEGRATDAANVVRTVISVNKAESQWPQLPARLPGSAMVSAMPHNALFAVFTSGSTGKPKGVVINHSCFCSWLATNADFYQLDSTSRVLQFSSYTFDASVMEHIAPLMVGGCLCVHQHSARTSNLPEAIRQTQANFLFLTPTVARLFRPQDMPSVKTLLVGGEALSQSDIETWSHHVRMIQIYGPAECCICVTSIFVTPATEDPRIIGNGKGALCWVVDPRDHTKLAPVGAIGELVIEGPIVGRGYVGDCRTAASFISPPPWRSQFCAGEKLWRMYRTGDLVQYVAGGMIRFVGRRDSQVKFHGQRLEFDEVQYHIREVFPRARDVVVDLVVPADNNGAPVLVGFITRGDKHDDEENAIFSAPCDEFRALADCALSNLFKRLPQYMVPSVLVSLMAIPTTSTGKTDRARLRERASQLTRAELEAHIRRPVEHRTPGSAMEVLLYELLADLLHTQLFSMNDNFFSLGGDSVLAMRLAHVARQAGIELPAQKIFETPVLADLALAMETRRSDQDISPFSLVGNLENRTIIMQTAKEQCGLATLDQIEDIYPCTPIQEDTMICTVASPQLNYVGRTVFKIHRAIDIQRLKTAWATVIRQNPILRTRLIQCSDEKILQVVLKDDVAWQHPTCLDDYILDDTKLGMRFGEPLLRLALVQGETNPCLILTINRVLDDAWTSPRILQQVEAAYYGEKLHSLPFRIFIDHLQKANFEQMEDFWRNNLAGFTGPLFPSGPSLDYVPDTVQKMSRWVHLPRVRGLGVTLSDVIRLAWALTLSKYASSNDIVFAIALAGRNVPVSNIEQILGPTIAMVPLRVQLQPEQTVHDMLQALHKQVVAIMPFEQIGFGNISKLNAGAAAACQLQSLLVVQPFQPESASSIFGSVLDEYSTEITDSFILMLEVRLCGEDQFERLLNTMIMNRDKNFRELFPTGLRILRRDAVAGPPPQYSRHPTDKRGSISGRWEIVRLSHASRAAQTVQGDVRLTAGPRSLLSLDPVPRFPSAQARGATEKGLAPSTGHIPLCKGYLSVDSDPLDQTSSPSPAMVLHQPGSPRR